MAYNSADQCTLPEIFTPDDLMYKVCSRHARYRDEVCQPGPQAEITPVDTSFCSGVPRDGAHTGGLAPAVVVACAIL